MVECLYPEEWKSFITNSSKCEEGNPNQYEDSNIDITFPQPGLPEKITPRVIILVEQCCLDITSRDAEGFNAITRNMSLDEYIEQRLNETTGGPVFTINSGSITLDRNPAYKEVQGIKTLDPSNPAGVTVYSKKGDKLYTISYVADPSDYDTYLPGIQKIVDSFKILLS